MVRLSRPERAAYAVQSGILAVPARIRRAVACMAAIIDALRIWTTPRNAFSLLLSSICPLKPLRTRSFSVYPQCACAWVFALAIYSIQNQGADHLTS